MSKKDKAKFRRRLKAQLLKEMSQTETQIQQAQEPRPKTLPITPSSVAAKPQEAISPGSRTPEIMNNASTETLNYTKKDLKKSALIIGSIVIIIAVLSIVDTKINILPKIGEQIFRVLHISG